MPCQALQDEFIKLRNQAIWHRQTVNTFNHLFDSGPEIEQILSETASRFFTDLNTIMQEYTVLLACRLTGPAESFGKANLSAQRFTASMRGCGCITPEIERRRKSPGVWRAPRLREHGEPIEAGTRNKIIAQSDLEVHVEDISLGAHNEEVMLEFFENLQAYFDASGNAVGVGPLDFRSTPGPGDAIDLVRKLERANDAARD